MASRQLVQLRESKIRLAAKDKSEVAIIDFLNGFEHRKRAELVFQLVEAHMKELESGRPEWFDTLADTITRRIEGSIDRMAARVPQGQDYSDKLTNTVGPAHSETVNGNIAQPIGSNIEEPSPSPSPEPEAALDVDTSNIMSELRHMKF